MTLSYVQSRNDLSLILAAEQLRGKVHKLSLVGGNYAQK